MTAGDIVVISEEAGGRKGNYFDGVDDYVLHDAHAVARVAANDTVGTYTAWIYINDTAGTYTILSAGDNDNTNEFLQFLVSAGKLQIFLEHGGSTQFSIVETVGSIPARTWTHVAVVQNGTRPLLYVNGELRIMTDSTSTDLTFWYDELTNVDKFAIGVKESNATHTQDFMGAIGRVQYFNVALTAEDILENYKGETNTRDPTGIETARVFDITMETDGITDDGSGADDGTPVGHAYYGGLISNWSYHLNFDGHITGHAAEFMNTFIDGSKYVTIIKKGD